MKNTKMTNRRDVIKMALFAYGGLGLKSLLLGLPPAFILNRAVAAGSPKYLILSSVSDGAPINCNAPGCYVPGIDHPKVPGFETSTSFNLGPVTVEAAQPWSNLPAGFRANLNFFHFASYMNSHAEAQVVLTSNEALKGSTGSGSEMIPSAVAQINATPLGTIDKRPIIIGDQKVNVTYESIPIGTMLPKSLIQLFNTNNATQAQSISDFRNSALDDLYADLRANGTATQKKFLDDHVLSRSQAKSLAERMGTLMSEVTNENTDRNQVITAAALVAAGAAPVIMIRLKFGEDNHVDPNLANEVSQHNESIAALGTLYEKLVEFGIVNKTTFAIHNVFGRTHVVNKDGGRDHNRLHNVMVLAGPNVRPGVIGGLTAPNENKEGSAIPINIGNNNFIPLEQTLHSSVKTLLSACGISDNDVNARLPVGQIVKSALIE